MHNLIVSVSQEGGGFRFAYGDAYTRDLLKRAASSILRFIAEQEEIDVLINEGKITPTVADPSGVAQYLEVKNS